MAGQHFCLIPSFRCLEWILTNNADDWYGFVCLFVDCGVLLRMCLCTILNLPLCCYTRIAVESKEFLIAVNASHEISTGVTFCFVWLWIGTSRLYPYTSGFFLWWTQKFDSLRNSWNYHNKKTSKRTRVYYSWDIPRLYLQYLCYLCYIMFKKIYACNGWVHMRSLWSICK